LLLFNFLLLSYLLFSILLARGLLASSFPSVQFSQHDYTALLGALDTFKRHYPRTINGLLSHFISSISNIFSLPQFVPDSFSDRLYIFPPIVVPSLSILLFCFLSILFRTCSRQLFPSHFSFNFIRLFFLLYLSFFAFIFTFFTAIDNAKHFLFAFFIFSVLIFSVVESCKSSFLSSLNLFLSLVASSASLLLLSSFFLLPILRSGFFFESIYNYYYPEFTFLSRLDTTLPRNSKILIYGKDRISFLPNHYQLFLDSTFVPIAHQQSSLCISKSSLIVQSSLDLSEYNFLLLRSFGDKLSDSIKIRNCQSTNRSVLQNLYEYELVQRHSVTVTASNSFAALSANNPRIKTYYLFIQR